MLIGEHKHTLDTKKRVSLPAKFRKELGKTVIISKGLDSCLYVYSVKEWKIFSGKIGALSMGQGDTRSFARYFLGGAVEVDIDSAGRILIPDNLKESARLETKMVVVGLGSHVELWNEDLWTKDQTILDKNADAIAQKLGEIGVI